MTIILSTPTHTRPIAAGYKPDALPPRAILNDWLKLSNSKMSMPELTEKLKTGQAFMFAEGGIMLEWQEA